MRNTTAKKKKSEKFCANGRSRKRWKKFVSFVEKVVTDVLLVGKTVILHTVQLGYNDHIYNKLYSTLTVINVTRFNRVWLYLFVYENILDVKVLYFFTIFFYEQLY